MSREIELPLDSAAIQSLIPHRYPFLLVDRVIEFEDRKRVVGLKNVTANEAFFAGHFPGRPIMPGVLILEALAQVGAIFAKLCLAESEQGLTVFSGADSVKFRRPVVPGDVLRLEMVFIRSKLRMMRMEGTASVDGEIACQGILNATEVGNAELR